MLFVAKQKPNENHTGGILTAILALSVSLLNFAGSAMAGDSGAADLGAIRRQLERIKSEETTERKRVDQDEQLIRNLEQQLSQFQASQAKLAAHTEALELTGQKLGATTTQLQQTQEQLAKGTTDEQFGSYMSRYLGSHQFTWNGAVAGSFIYDRA